MQESKPADLAAADPWAVYEPSDEIPWNLRRVVHLHRRAGFAATWDELQRDLKEGPEASVARLLAGTARTSGVPKDFEATAMALAEAAIVAGDPRRLKAWWVYRMIASPDPLGERLTLMWHDHFATSNEKVGDLAAIRRQNETLRRLARAPFGELLNAMARDPALLVWLDAADNRPGRPNENLARELLELFTLGVGHYTEADVKESARALTGWTVKSGSYREIFGPQNQGAGPFREIPGRQDQGAKTILGQTGRWTGGDLLRIALEQPATADRLAWRLCRLLLGEGAVDQGKLESLAKLLCESDLDIGRAVEIVLRSRAFFATSNVATRVLGPAEFVLGLVRALELTEPPPSTLALADWMGLLGLNLFYPPNVGGWPGGRAWLNSQAVIGRTNYVAALLGGSRVGRPGPVDLPAFAAHHGRGDDRDAIVDFYAELLLGAVPSVDRRRRIWEALGDVRGTDRASIQRVVSWILASPEAQLA